MTSMYNSFKAIGELLNVKNEKYEQIYKLNRDATQRSKKVIFGLHRIPEFTEEKKKQQLLDSSLNEITKIENQVFKNIALELKDSDHYQYINAYTGGVQEYIEALSFHHFIVHETVITYSDVKKRLCFTSSDSVPVQLPISQKEFMLGIADLTGELMRYCIKSVSIGDYDICYKVCDTFRQINECFCSLGYISSKDLFHKINVFHSSLAKVENACYSLQLRKSELPPDMLATFLCITESENNFDSGVG